MTSIIEKFTLSLVATISLIVLAWISHPKSSQGMETSREALEHFATELRKMQSSLTIGSRRSIPVPSLSLDQVLVFAPAPYVGDIRSHPGISGESLKRIRDDMGMDAGGARTTIYLLENGDIKQKLTITACNLLVGTPDALVVNTEISTLSVEFVEATKACGPSNRIERWNAQGPLQLLEAK